MSQDNVLADFRLMSYGTSLVARVCAGRFLLLMALLVLGLNYSADALATCARVLSSTGAFTGKCVHPESTSTTCLCSTATTSIKLGASHHGIEIACGDPSQQIVLGQENLHEYFLGASESHTTPRKIIVDVGGPTVNVGGTPSTPPTTTCRGTDLTTNPPLPLGQGTFLYQVQYEIDLATSADLTKRTADNECVNFDPAAPPTKGKIPNCRVNQSCTNTGPSAAEIKVEAYCQAGVKVTGKLTWVKTTDDPPPPFTGCAQDAAGYPATDCTMVLGGLPVDDQGRVLPDVCNLIFPQTTSGVLTLQQKQMLSFTQKYAGQCITPGGTSLANYNNPVGVGAALSRECHSDGFDNVARGCPVLTDGQQVFAHTATAEETAKIAASVGIDVTPLTLNLGCLSTGKDSGVIKATICGAADFNVSTVTVSSNGKFDPNVAPVLQTVKPLSFLIEQATGGACGNDPFPDLTLTYPTCAANNGGVANAVLEQFGPVRNKDIVPLVLQGTLNQQPGDLLRRIFGGTDTVEVVNAP